jgi:hypothetical protein
LGTVMPKWSTPSTPGIGEPFADVRACARSPSVALGAPSATADSEKISRAIAVQRVARFAERFLIDPPLVDAAEANALNGSKQDRPAIFKPSPAVRLLISSCQPSVGRDDPDRRGQALSRPPSRSRDFNRAAGRVLWVLALDGYSVAARRSARPTLSPSIGELPWSQQPRGPRRTKTMPVLYGPAS